MFRTYMGELAMPGYDKLYKKGDTFSILNIYLIWINYYISVLFMLVMMLNFMIAEITQIYSEAK